MNPTTTALVDRFARFERLVEIGIGRKSEVASALAKTGSRVTATDIHSRPVPADVAFVRDDITRPDPDVYADADAVYGLNLPRELHRPARAVAREASATLLFTTLGGEFPAVRATPETLPRETLYVAASRGPTPNRGEEHA